MLRQPYLLWDGIVHTSHNDYDLLAHWKEKKVLKRYSLNLTRMDKEKNQHIRKGFQVEKNEPMRKVSKEATYEDKMRKTRQTICDKVKMNL